MKNKRLNRNESMLCVMDVLSSLEDNDIVKIEDTFSGEIIEGPVINVWQLVIDINDTFKNKCNFKIFY